MRTHSILAVLIATTLAACSNIKPYRTDLATNLRIQTKTAGSLFQRVDAGLHIYTVDAACQLNYQGTVYLDEPSVEVGLPSNRESYLEFYFVKSARLANSTSSITHGTLLHPRPGQRYAAEVSYANDLYKVKLRETASGRAIARRPLESCGVK